MPDKWGGSPPLVIVPDFPVKVHHIENSKLRHLYSGNQTRR